MEKSNKKTVNMTFKALYSFILNANIRNLAGILGLLMSISAIVLLVFKWDSMDSPKRVAYILIGLMFTVINPLLLAFKTFRQLKLSPSYKAPIEYNFTDEGITVSLGEQSMDIKWENICRIMKTNAMIAIFTSRVHAFVIPLSELGEDREKLISRMVSFTAQYRPQLSGSLKRYQSGKGL